MSIEGEKGIIGHLQLKDGKVLKKAVKTVNPLLC